MRSAFKYCFDLRLKNIYWCTHFSEHIMSQHVSLVYLDWNQNFLLKILCLFPLLLVTAKASPSFQIWVRIFDTGNSITAFNICIFLELVYRYCRRLKPIFSRLANVLAIFQNLLIFGRDQILLRNLNSMLMRTKKIWGGYSIICDTHEFILFNCYKRKCSYFHILK